MAGERSPSLFTSLWQAPPPRLSGANAVAVPLHPPRPSGPDEAVSHTYASNASSQFGVASTTNPRPNRYEDGEVRRYGAGESYRPFNRDRSPRLVRSPLRDRGRTPPPASDSYVPGRSPRRRSRSADRFRRERSRDRDSGERWRRSRSRARSPPMRRPSPRRSPVRRSPPRFMSPRRDDRGLDRGIDRRDDRRDDRGIDRGIDRGLDRGFDRGLDRGLDRGVDRDDRPRSPLRREFEIRDMRRRSRSPFDRERLPIRRDRSPPRRSPPPGPRGGGAYRPRSRSPDRRERDDRYPPPAYRRPSPPPLRDSVNTSAMHSRSGSGRSSPRPMSVRREERSLPQSPARSHVSTAPTPTASVPPAREAPKPAPPPSQSSQPAQASQSTPRPPATDFNSTLAKSPPRGPAALRAPPTGPATARNFTSPVAPQASPAPRIPPQAPSGPSRAGNTSPTVPPAGPRGYVPPARGTFPSRGGRGSWSAGPPRHSISGASQPGGSPTIPPAGPAGGTSTNAIPTGPRAQGASSSTSTTLSPSLGSKPFNPPTGPSSHIPPAHSRPSLAQSLLNTMPPIIPGGKFDPTAMPIEMDPQHRRLREEEERFREELRIKQEKLRKSLRHWDKLERESKGFELKSELSEKCLENLAGEGVGGAAF
ncbi:hypothetical protein VTI74DRAFT_6615 [Chaetomium olivicolor]